jgi:hypothetical protein
MEHVMHEPEHVTPAAPDEGRAAKVAADVVRHGWSLVGVLNGELTRRLRRAVGEVAACSSDTSTGGQLHLLSGLSQHPDLAEVFDWPPLLAVVLELLSPNVYINHSRLDVHPPTGARRWHRDNGLMGRDTRLLWRDQPRVTLKVAVYLTDVESPDDGLPVADVARRAIRERASMGRAGTWPPPVARRQDSCPFYWAPGELPLDTRPTASSA